MKMDCPLCGEKCWDHVKHCRYHWLWASIAAGLRFISEESKAQAVTDWLVDEMEEPRLLARFTADLSMVRLGRGGVFSFGTTQPYLVAACLGLVTSETKFRVLSKTFRTDFSIEFEAVECQ